MQKRKYDLGKHLAYGVGSLGDSLSYNIFYSYFIYFITTFAGIRPAAAGVISFVAVAWDAVTDPLIGYVSDHSHSKHGRRCPFLLMYSVPMGLTVFALFYNPTLSESEKVLYYLVANILFWLFLPVWIFRISHLAQSWRQAMMKGPDCGNGHDYL